MNFPFKGQHLLLTFHNCNLSALLNTERLQQELEISAQKAGAHQLDFVVHQFPNGGFTCVLLLSESHISIHTYPEHKSCFMDFFTCGQNTNGDQFLKLMQDYLKPEKVVKTIIHRGT